jgi:hypothetical protein
MTTNRQKFTVKFKRGAATRVIGIGSLQHNGDK